jgi:hypothetical protein
MEGGYGMKEGLQKGSNRWVFTGGSRRQEPGVARTMVRKALRGMFVAVTLTMCIAGPVSAGQYNYDWQNCPCIDPSVPGSALFASLVGGNSNLIACTNDTPPANFVRLVDDHINLVVLFEFPGQLYCGSQVDGDPTIPPLPITPDEFASCKRLMLKVAAHQKLACPSE